LPDVFYYHQEKLVKECPQYGLTILNFYAFVIVLGDCTDASSGCEPPPTPNSCVSREVFLRISNGKWELL